MSRRCALSMGRPKFLPPQLPHFPNNLSETQKRDRYPEVEPAGKIRLTSGDGKVLCENGEFWRTFGSFLFVFLSRSPGRTVRPTTTRPMRAPNACFHVMRSFQGARTPKIFGGQNTVQYVQNSARFRTTSKFVREYLPYG